MSELLREAMVVEARRWLASKRDVYGWRSIPEEAYVEQMLADFVMHMTGGEGPELRYMAPHGPGDHGPEVGEEEG